MGFVPAINYLLSCILYLVFSNNLYLLFVGKKCVLCFCTKRSYSLPIVSTHRLYLKACDNADVDSDSYYP